MWQLLLPGAQCPSLKGAVQVRLQHQKCLVCSKRLCGCPLHKDKDKDKAKLNELLEQQRNMRCHHGKVSTGFHAT